MIVRQIKCDVPGCGNSASELSPTAGWPEWGDIHGKQNDETGDTTFNLCPDHLDLVFSYIMKIGKESE